MYSPQKKHKILLSLVGICALAVSVFYFSATDSLASNEEALREELRRFERELQRHREIKDERERQLAIVETEIESIEAQIRYNRIIVEETEAAIQQTQAQIDILNAEIKQNKELLSDLILSIYKMDETSSVEILFQTETLSEFYGNIRNIELIQDSATKTLVSIQEVKEEIEKQQEGLNERMEEQQRLLHMNEIQQGQLEARRAHQQRLVQASSNEVDRVARSAREIRNSLFRLTGGGGVSLAFHEALDYARLAESHTGVRPAFLLAILKIESSWGGNVGTCNVVSRSTGELRHVNTGQRMGTMPAGSPRDDVGAFVEITSSLGRNWRNTPVSCAASYGGTMGYGGAMGPAQFIPTTWRSIISDFQGRLGYSPDPWDIQDAFIASGILLQRYGAASQNPSDEIRAAQQYVGPSAGSDEYTSPVMQMAEDFQRDIDTLDGN